MIKKYYSADHLNLASLIKCEKKSKIIIRNYNDIRKGKIANFKIRKVNYLVIDNYFKDGQDKIIIAMLTKV